MMYRILALVTALVIDTVRAEEEPISDVGGAITVVLVCASVVVLVVVLALCGGCTPMEVGSNDHAASGGRKTNYTQYSGIATDVNTHVMTSGTTFADDPYQPQTQALPYDPHPRTSNAFTGYNPQTAPYQGQMGQPGLPPAALQGGYQAQSSHMPGANRHFSESAEPPPPDYSEATRSTQGHGQFQGHMAATAPAQPYGW